MSIPMTPAKLEASCSSEVTRAYSLGNGQTEAVKEEVACEETSRAQALLSKGSVFRVIIILQIYRSGLRNLNCNPGREPRSDVKRSVVGDLIIVQQTPAPVLSWVGQ